MRSRLIKQVRALEDEVCQTLWHAYGLRLEAILTPEEFADYAATIFDPSRRQTPLARVIGEKIEADPYALQLNQALGTLAQRRKDVHAELVMEKA